MGQRRVERTSSATSSKRQLLSSARIGKISLHLPLRAEKGSRRRKKESTPLFGLAPIKALSQGQLPCLGAQIPWGRHRQRRGKGAEFIKFTHSIEQLISPVSAMRRKSNEGTRRLVQACYLVRHDIFLKQVRAICYQTCFEGRQRVEVSRERVRPP